MGDADKDKELMCDEDEIFDQGHQNVKDKENLGEDASNHPTDIRGLYNISYMYSPPK